MVLQGFCYSCYTQASGSTAAEVLGIWTEAGIVTCQNREYAGFFFQITPVGFCHRQISFMLVISNAIKPKSMQKWNDIGVLTIRIYW